MSLELYRNAVRDAARLQATLDRVGKPQCGSVTNGGGVGNIHTVSMTINHQDYPGANNYHNLDTWGDRALLAAIKSMWPQIKTATLTQSRLAVDALRKDAEAEFVALFGKPMEPEILRSAIAKAEGGAA